MEKRRQTDIDNNEETFITNDNLKLTCHLFYDSFAEREETIRRGYYTSKLTITGEIIHISDIPSAQDFCQGSRTIAIELFATEKVIFDKDYNSNGVEMTLFIGAPIWILLGTERKIILNGRNGRKVTQRKRRINNSPDGAHGQNGESGTAGGHFFGVGKYFHFQTSSEFNSSELDDKTKLHYYPFCYVERKKYLKFFLCDDENFSIQFHVNGGNGGRGQNGGQGLNGLNGTVFNVSEILLSNDIYRQNGGILKKAIPPPVDEPFLKNGTSQIIHGQMATLGGRGGNAGLGGDGGKEGGVILVTTTDTDCVLADEEPITPHDGARGKNGKNGEIGRRGLPGTPGSDVSFDLFFGDNNQIELRNIKYFQHQLYLESFETNTVIPVRRREIILPTKLYDYSSGMFNYRNFLDKHMRENANHTLQEELFSSIDGCHISTCVLC